MFPQVSSQNIKVEWVGNNIQITDEKTQKGEFYDLPKITQGETDSWFADAYKLGLSAAYFVCLLTDTHSHTNTYTLSPE